MSKARKNIGRLKGSRGGRRSWNAVEIIERRLMKNDPAFAALVDEATVNAHVAKLIHDARTTAGMTQSALAELAGTKQPVIARLEDSEYEGHSLTMLQRIAAALGQKLEIRMVPMKGASRMRKAG